MELVEGKRLKDALCKKNYKAFCKSIGSAVAQMHLAGIIHGDLTTSNILLNNRKALVFVDFGLGFFSQKLEDKAVDLLVFKKTFEATHCRLSSGWKAIIESYCLNSHEGKAVVGQIASVEARGRYL
jgi:Kae1-associated kinase Bud32